MKTTVLCYLFMRQDYTPDFMGKAWCPQVLYFKPDETESRVFVRDIEVEVDVPDDFNPVPAQVAALEKKKAAALADYQRTVAEINTQLSNLLAITNEVSA